MGTQTMGSQAGVGDSSVPKLPGLSRQGSLYSLTFDEVQNQLGNLGKPLGSLNLDELLRTVEATQTVDNGGQNLSRGGVGQPGPGLGKQSSISLSRDLKEKTVEELWREIQQGGKSSSQGQDPERQNTLGEMTLEDFLVQAGIAIDAAAGVGGGGGEGGVGGGNDSSNVGQSNLGGGGVDPNGGPLTNVAQHGQWMPYQMLPHQQQQQHGMMPMFMPGHPVPQPLSGGALSDTGYADRQLVVSTSAMMGTLSDTQAVGVGRKRIISGDVVERTVERRQKRMIKNRESAARSRARKQAYTNELENKVSRLEEENERLRRMMEVEKALPSVPPPPPKHQLRRTNSGPL
ncbi:ABSCISIC ACID-INSENSITIVE 5-like protein 2 [Silene latifolia]|uniref:ABSCISIC ACID-INSENSITIVE 5-like protein 2 n=1 Tax=Silene latifolia TaxID=37657 RepID=UPI003D76B8D0